MEMCNWCNLTAEEQKWKLTESSSWIVYLADKQDYIGRCVIVLKRHCASLSELTDEEWMDLKRIIDKLESSFKDTLGANLSNWSCLLNDFYKSENPNPHLHLHFRPRYKNPIVLNGNEYVDKEFGHHYDRKKEFTITEADRQELYMRILNALKANEHNMQPKKIEDYIVHELLPNKQEVALEFIDYLKDKNITFYRDNSECWKNKIYYWAKLDNWCVCFIAIHDPEESDNHWTVWSDDMNSEWFEKYNVDNNIKEQAWSYVNLCGKCGACDGGQRKNIWGKEFNAVCGCTFRIDNPQKEDLPFLKTIVDITVEEIICSLGKQKKIKICNCKIERK